MFRVTFISCILILLTGNMSYAQIGHKVLCQKFFPKWKLTSCMQAQNKSANKYGNWSSLSLDNNYRKWADQCREQNIVRDRVTYYVNYYGLEKCVKKLKDRQDELDAMAKQTNIIIVN